MRVLQVINSLGTGGAEKLLLESIPLYNQKGIQMDLLVLNGTEYPFLKELKASNCCHIYSLGNGSVYNPLHIFKLIKFLKKYDLVHVHLFPAQYWIAFAKIISFSNTKLVYTEHCTTNRRMQNALLKIVDNFVYRFYQKIVTISTEVDIEIKKHIKKETTFFQLINNGVNVSKIIEAVGYSKSELGLGLKETDLVLLQVSRFQAQKDQPTLIKAVQHLPKNVHLLLVGEGELKQDNMALASQLNVEKRVHFLGIRMDIPKLLKTADVVVLSTFFEGLSLSSIEGLASGKPFVASKAPGLMEIIENAGIVFPIQDDKTLAFEINSLLNNPNYYQETATKCVERAKQYDISLMVDQHIDLYKKLA